MAADSERLPTAHRDAPQRGAARRAQRPGQLRGGPHGLSRDEVAENQRERIFAAMRDTVAERGYESTSIAEVIGRAGVSRRTFYELYDSREACFMDVLDALGERLLGRVATASRTNGRAGDGAGDAVDALVAACFEDPAAVRTCFVEALAGGAGARARRAELVERLVGELEPTAEHRPGGREQARVAARAAVGSILGLAAGGIERAAPEDVAWLTRTVLGIAQAEPAR